MKVDYKKKTPINEVSEGSTAEDSTEPKSMEFSTEINSLFLHTPVDKTVAETFNGQIIKSEPTETKKKQSLFIQVSSNLIQSIDSFLSPKDSANFSAASSKINQALFANQRNWMERLKNDFKLPPIVITKINIELATKLDIENKLAFHQAYTELLTLTKLQIQALAKIADPRLTIADLQDKAWFKSANQIQDLNFLCQHDSGSSMSALFSQLQQIPRGAEGLLHANLSIASLVKLKENFSDAHQDEEFLAAACLVKNGATIEVAVAAVNGRSKFEVMLVLCLDLGPSELLVFENSVIANLEAANAVTYLFKKSDQSATNKAAALRAVSGLSRRKISVIYELQFNLDEQEALTVLRDMVLDNENVVTAAKYLFEKAGLNASKAAALEAVAGLSEQKAFAIPELKITLADQEAIDVLREMVLTDKIVVLAAKHLLENSAPKSSKAAVLDKIKGLSWQQAFLIIELNFTLDNPADQNALAILPNIVVTDMDTVEAAKCLWQNSGTNASKAAVLEVVNGLPQVKAWAIIVLEPTFREQ